MRKYIHWSMFMVTYHGFGRKPGLKFSVGWSAFTMKKDIEYKNEIVYFTRYSWISEDLGTTYWYIEKVHKVLIGHHSPTQSQVVVYWYFSICPWHLFPRSPLLLSRYHLLTWLQALEEQEGGGQKGRLGYLVPRNKPQMLWKERTFMDF